MVHKLGETFHSWLMEAKWSRRGGAPPTQEYISTGMTSIPAHILVLPTSCLASPTTPLHKLWPKPNLPLTKLLMAITQLLNDIQSYQLKEKPEANIEDSIKFVQLLLDQMKKEFVQHVLDKKLSDLPEPSRRLHLGCLKVFYTFFNSSNHYDSDTDMLRDIQKALVVPL